MKTRATGKLSVSGYGMQPGLFPSPSNLALSVRNLKMSYVEQFIGV